MHTEWHENPKVSYCTYIIQINKTHILCDYEINQKVSHQDSPCLPTIVINDWPGTCIMY